MRAGVQTARGQSFVVGSGLVGERQELRQQALLARTLALLQQPLLVIRVADILAAVVAARVPRLRMP